MILFIDCLKFKDFDTIEYSDNCDITFYHKMLELQRKMNDGQVHIRGDIDLNHGLHQSLQTSSTDGNYIDSPEELLNIENKLALKQSVNSEQKHYSTCLSLLRDQSKLCNGDNEKWKFVISKQQEIIKELTKMLPQSNTLLDESNSTIVSSNPPIERSHSSKRFKSFHEKYGKKTK